MVTLHRKVADFTAASTGGPFKLHDQRGHAWHQPGVAGDSGGGATQPRPLGSGEADRERTLAAPSRKTCRAPRGRGRRRARRVRRARRARGH